MSNAVSQIDKDWIIHEIILWICDEGKSKAQIKNLVLDTLAGLSDEDALDLIDEAFRKIAEIHYTGNNAQVIIESHIAMYEKIYLFFQSIDHAIGMLKAMKGKERLLGLHNDSNKLTLKKSETTINHATSSDLYDLTKLTNGEKYELEQLLEKAILDGERK
jgi:hypothetical protein